MNNALIKIIIGVVPATIVGVITIYRDEVKNYLINSKKHRYLVGKWECSWKNNASGKTVLDNIDVKSINGKILKGEGHTKDVGQWKFKGDIAESTITLIYKSGDGYDHSGVIILRLDVYNRKQMEGVWSQHTRGHLVTGTTKWRKL